jgi:hypothetical protein
MADQDRERWTKLVADFEASDLTQREFASERGISFSNLRNWIYRLRKESRPLVEAAPTSSGQGQARVPTPARRSPRWWDRLRPRSNGSLGAGTGIGRRAATAGQTASFRIHTIQRRRGWCGHACRLGHGFPGSTRFAGSLAASSPPADQYQTLPGANKRVNP